MKPVIDHEKHTVTVKIPPTTKAGYCRVQCKGLLGAEVRMEYRCCWYDLMGKEWGKPGPDCPAPRGEKA